MSLPTASKRHYVEVAPHTLHAVRTAGRVIEFCRECALDDPAQLQLILSAWTEGQSVTAHAAISPPAIHWHLATAGECRSDAEVRQVAARLPHRFREPLDVIGCNAADGTSLSPGQGRRCLLAVTPADLLAVTAAEAIERGIVIATLGSATLGCIGAITTALAPEAGGSVWLWDIGSARSHVFAVSANGVEGVVPCDVGFNTIFAAVQQALGAGGAVAAVRRLFFSADPALPAAGGRIAAEIVPRLQRALPPLATGQAPVGFTCVGLTHRQAWFSHEIARALAVPSWAPAPGPYLARLGLSLAPGNDVGLSTDLLALLHAAAEHAHGRSAWHPNWGALFRAGTPAAAGETPSARPGPVQAEAPSPPPHANGEPARPEARPAGRPAPADTGAKPPAVAAAAATPATRPAAAPSERTPGNGGGPPTVPTPPPAKAAAPPRPAGARDGRSASPAEPAPPAVAGTPPRPEPTVIIVRKRGYGILIGLVLGLAGAAAGAKFYREAEAARAALARQERALREQASAFSAERAAARDQLREAEQRATDAMRLAAEETERVRQRADAAKETAVARASREAEERVRRQTAAELASTRRANPPGTLAVATSPPGAEVTLDNGAVRRTPATFADVAPGRHRLRITLPGHQPLEFEAAVEGGKATDLGTVRLERATGSATVASTPGGIEFSIRKSGTGVGAEPFRRGRTPAQFDDLPPGDYEVRFSRPGWPEQTERLSVVKAGTTRVSTTFTGATVTVVSTPKGATVRERGAVVGTTPLTLSGVRPGPLEYELQLDGHESAVVRGNALAGRELRLEGKLLPEDRMATEVELRTPPRPLVTTSARFGRRYLGMPDQVTVSFVVQRDGTVRDVRVVDRVRPDLAAHCIQAVSAWRFYPALTHAGHPVNARMSMPLRIAGK